MLVWLNGRFVPARAARVSPLDRGLLHGDGAYDTWRTYDGRPFAVAAHVRRLARATRVLGLPPPGRPAVWEHRSRVLVARNGLADAAVRLTITRGATGEALAPRGRGRPTVLLVARPLAAPPPRGAAIVTLPFARDAAPPWSALKLVGHASAVVGHAVAARRGADEGVYVTPDGEVTEGVSSNVFLVERGTLVTPPETAGILPGVTRAIVIALARRARVAVREERVTVARLRRAGEVFVTASTIEVVPVVRVDGRAVGTGRPGDLTRRLAEAFRARVRATLRLDSSPAERL